MNPAEPTAGEWKAERTGVYVDAPDGECVRVANVDIDSCHDISYPTACTNARLFAASKDMLSALQDAEFHLADLSPDNSALGGIRAAIAKAKGEA